MVQIHSPRPFFSVTYVSGRSPSHKMHLCRYRSLMRYGICSARSAINAYVRRLGQFEAA